MAAEINDSHHEGHKLTRRSLTHESFVILSVLRGPLIFSLTGRLGRCCEVWALHCECNAVQYNLPSVWGAPMIETTPPVNDTAAPSSKPALDIHEILKILPHRYPLLLIDRVLELKRKKSIIAIKNVTINEPFFNGHFPGLPIMPGVLIVEAIAQAGGALLLTEVEDRNDKVMVFTGIERAKFRRPVSPGDQLRIEVEVKGWRAIPRMIAAKMHGVAFVAGKRVAEATVSCQLIDSSRGRGDSSDGTAAE